MRLTRKREQLVSNGQQLAALHSELSELYRGKSTDQVRIKKLWLAIDRLEDESRSE